VMRPRNERIVKITNSYLGEALGELFVSKYFPPHAKQSALEMVGDIIDAYRNRIKNLEWMSEPTKQYALEKLHAVAPTVIIKDDDAVVAYAMVLLQEGRKAYPDLEPMFVNFENLSWRGKPLYDYNFYAMGQICVDKAYRSKGLFDMLYQKHKEIYQHEFDFIVTEISTSNSRSLNAHKRVGFVTINTFTDPLDEWDVVLWDWR